MAEQLKPIVEFNLGQPVKQFRFVPISPGPGEEAFLAVHSSCAGVDPYHRMFFLPTDTLKLTAFTAAGERLWQRDLGPGVMPGVWFCPVLVFDLDDNGTDDIWLVGNHDADHPMDFETYQLERISAATGEVMQVFPWPQVEHHQAMSLIYRNFINAGFSKGNRRLITCQGTYGPMQLQCYDSAMQMLWSRNIAKTEPGARGSHMFPVVDIDGDGRDELLWGERCIDIDTGEDIWIGDVHAWSGHSDVIQPTLDAATGAWSVYTCRETQAPSGAVVMYDGAGEELWGHREMGHMDMGWTARLGPAGEHYCYALEVRGKTAGPDGTHRDEYVEYFYDAAGNALPVPFPLYQTLPVDFNGDGLHELMYTGGESRGAVIDRTGKELYRLAGGPAFGGKVLDAPGEQIITSDADGTVRIYACPDAQDTPAAQARYANPYYAASLRIWAMAYNRANLGGL